MDELNLGHLDWIASSLARLGATARGPIEPFKIRPWSSVAFVNTDRGRLWFKANEPALSFEADLLVVLSHAAPGRVLKPLDRDSATGWFLTADGGPKGTDVDVPVVDAIEAIVNVQRATSERIDEVLRASTPDRRPEVLPEVLDEAIAHPDAGRGGERCEGLRGRFAVVCEQLATDGRLAVVNSDHKPDHVFAGPPVRVYDWGDSAVCHPLADLPFIEREFGAAGAAAMADGWGHDRHDPTVAAAGAAAELIEADVWLRTSPEGLARHPDGIDVALSRLADRLEAIG
ncbi:MAG: hypothetical protein AAF081_08055 [Actinomycetota bacterium]